MGNLLIPKLEAAVDKGEDGRLLTVLAAGKGGAIDMDDLDLKKSASVKRKADCATTYNDLMVEVLLDHLNAYYAGTCASKSETLFLTRDSWMGRYQSHQNLSILYQISVLSLRRN
jgi:hypothetical protein